MKTLDGEPLTGEEYLRAVAEMLKEHRPELFKAAHGRWSGPLVNVSTIAGLIWHGPGLLVIVSPWDTSDGLWLHVSISRRDRMPSYEELTEIRKRFFRPTDTVLHVWPPADEHYNYHDYCLHLWTPLDGSRPIPDLRGDGGGV